MKPLSDFPDDERRQELCKQVALRVQGMYVPFDQAPDFPKPDSTFSHVVDRVLAENKFVVSGPDSRLRFLWEAFTQYKLLPLHYPAPKNKKNTPPLSLFAPQRKDGWDIYHPLKIEFPVVGPRRQHWTSIANRQTLAAPLSAELRVTVEGYCGRIHELLNQRLSHLESWWQSHQGGSKRKQLDNSGSIDRLFSDLEQKRDILWSICHVSGFANPLEAPQPGGKIYHSSSAPQQLQSEFEPSDSERNLWAMIPKQQREPEGALFYADITHGSGPFSQERKNMYETLLERKLLLWYLMHKLIQDRRKNAAPLEMECIHNLTTLSREIEICQYKLSIFPPESSVVTSGKSEISTHMALVIHLGNIVMSLDFQPENLGFIQVLSDIIRLIQLFIDDGIKIASKERDSVERENKLRVLKILMKRRYFGLQSKLQGLSQSWENEHPLFQVAQKTLSILARFQSI